jgi:hypothetical protein
VVIAITSGEGFAEEMCGEGLAEEMCVWNGIYIGQWEMGWWYGGMVVWVERAVWWLMARGKRGGREEEYRNNSGPRWR